MTRHVKNRACAGPRARPTRLVRGRGWPELGAARGHSLAPLRGASGAPADRSLSQLVSGMIGDAVDVMESEELEL